MDPNKFLADAMEDSTECFAAQLLETVEYYRSDVFITYDQINKMVVGEFAVVLCRKCGCEFCPRNDAGREHFDYWRGQATAVYLIQRINQDSPFGRFPGVKFSAIEAEDAAAFLKNN